MNCSYFKISASFVKNEIVMWANEPFLIFWWCKPRNEIKEYFLIICHLQYSHFIFVSLIYLYLFIRVTIILYYFSSIKFHCHPKVNKRTGGTQILIISNILIYCFISFDLFYFILFVLFITLSMLQGPVWDLEPRGGGSLSRDSNATSTNASSLRTPPIPWNK